MEYQVTSREEIVRQSKTFNDKQYGGWLAVNTGNVVAKVNNYTLQPGDGLDMTGLQPNVKWASPIRIDVTTTPGGEITLTRLLYKEVK